MAQQQISKVLLDTKVYLTGTIKVFISFCLLTEPWEIFSQENNHNGEK